MNFNFYDIILYQVYDAIVFDAIIYTNILLLLIVLEINTNVFPRISMFICFIFTQKMSLLIVTSLYFFIIIY